MSEYNKLESILSKEVKRRTGCTYLAVAHMLFPPGGGARVRYYIKAPWKVKTCLGRRHPYLWVWHESFIYKIWYKWGIRVLKEEVIKHSTKEYYESLFYDNY